MKLLAISILCSIGGVFSYPQAQQQYSDEPERQDLPQPIIKESRRIIYSDEKSNNKIVKTVKVFPHYPSQPQDGGSSGSESLPIFSGSSSTVIPIIRYDKTQQNDGSYKHSYETGNNIIAEETGFIKNIGVKDGPVKDQEALVQHGSFKYTAPDGTVIFTQYTADEGGFRVEGTHLPTPPPIPDEIQKALEIIYEGIRQQQEADAREAKTGKKPKVVPEEELSNSVNDNYPTQYSKN